MQRSNARFVERLPLVLDRPAYAYGLTLLFSGAALLLRGEDCAASMRGAS